MLWAWEFSHSESFADNFFAFILALKLLRVVLDVSLISKLKEALLVGPLLVVVELSVMVMTMGGASFTSFMLCSFVKLSASAVDRVYINPFMKGALRLMPRWKMQLNRRLTRRHRRTREQKAAEEIKWRRVNEKVDLQVEGIEPLMDAYNSTAVDLTAVLCMPVVAYVLIRFRVESQVLSNYGVHENGMAYYASFNGFILAFAIVIEIIFLNTQELLYGWKIFDYILYQRYRFSIREHRWVLNTKFYDESIAETLQSIDLTSFSSQYYFMTALSALGTLLSMVGVTIALRWKYNMFSDQVCLLVFVIVFACADFVQELLASMARVQIKYLGWRGLWDNSKVEGTVDDRVSELLGVGDGRQENLQLQMLELQALNSERFRHRFVDSNRPWILNHLVELLTPETLDQTGPNGQPVVEYIRDVYADLVNLNRGHNLGYRSDVSSDNGEKDRGLRGWSSTPIRGPGRAVATLWLQRARKRRTFRQAVSHYITARTEDKCSTCGARYTDDAARANPTQLSVHLATNGSIDPRGMDHLIAQFEGTYSNEEKGLTLWRAFFRANAEFITECFVCTEHAGDAKRSPQRCSERKTRTNDFSTDDDSSDSGDEFDIVIVDRSASEGKIVAKWLEAARQRLGGTFPRPGARAAMEHRAKQMMRVKRNRSIRRGFEDRQDPKKQWYVQVNAASKAIARQWVNTARENKVERWKHQGMTLRRELNDALAAMPEEDDWYFSSALRMEGLSLAARASALTKDQDTAAAAASAEARRKHHEFDTFRDYFEGSLSARLREAENAIAAELLQFEVDARVQAIALDHARVEALKEVDERERAAQDEFEAAAPEAAQEFDMQRKHISDTLFQELASVEEERACKERALRQSSGDVIAKSNKELLVRRNAADQEIARIMRKAHLKLEPPERKWQAVASRWVLEAKHKIDIRAGEEAEAERRQKRNRRQT